MPSSSTSPSRRTASIGGPATNPGPGSRAFRSSISPRRTIRTFGAECALLRPAANQTGISQVVTFDYRPNPLVQQMRQMVAAGELGSLVLFHGHSRQDWATAPHVYSWRMGPANNSAKKCAKKSAEQDA